jgi:hypothetical protein
MNPSSSANYSTQRRFPRAPLKTPVEIWADDANLVGESENISAGGMLLRCQRTFARGARMRVLFNLPAGFSIQASCAVVHTLPQSRVGLEFLDLSYGSRAELNEFVVELLDYARRGTRVAKRLTVTLRSLRAADSQEELAETVILSRYGGLLICRANFQEGEPVFLRWPGGKRGSNAQIVYRRPGGPSGLFELGFEFKEHEDFWGLEFQPGN